jgi:hypothetical protein
MPSRDAETTMLTTLQESRLTHAVPTPFANRVRTSMRYRPSSAPRANIMVRPYPRRWWLLGEYELLDSVDDGSRPNVMGRTRRPDQAVASDPD